jgi:hypothetical protein
MTCVDRVALDLLSVSGVINIRLLQVLAFGKKAATASPPFTLRNRESYHITKWVAKAHWYADGEDKELPPDNENPGSRWRTKLKGEFCREPCAEISHSFAEPGMAVMVSGLMVLQWTSHRLMSVLRVLVPIPCTGFPPNKQFGQNTFLRPDFALRISQMKFVVGTVFHTRALVYHPTVNSPPIHRIKCCQDLSGSRHSTRLLS